MREGTAKNKREEKKGMAEIKREGNKKREKKNGANARIRNQVMCVAA